MCSFSLPRDAMPPPRKSRPMPIAIAMCVPYVTYKLEAMPQDATATAAGKVWKSMKQ